MVTHRLQRKDERLNSTRVRAYWYAREGGGKTINKRSVKILKGSGSKVYAPET